MTDTKIGILARTPGEVRAGDCDAALSSGVPDSDTAIGCTSGPCEAHEDHKFSWRRLQSVGVSPRKIQNPQVGICATKSELMNNRLVRFNFPVANVDDAIRSARNVMFVCNQ